MLASIAKQTFNLYTSPARFAWRQARRNLAILGKLAPTRKPDPEAAIIADQIFGLLCNQIGINPAALTKEQRIHQAKAAMANVEYGLGLALTEGIKATLLLSVRKDKAATPSPKSAVIEGEFHRQSTD